MFKPSAARRCQGLGGEVVKGEQRVAILNQALDRALGSFPLALERRRIAHPKAQDYADFQGGITAEICDWRNGFQGAVCTAALARTF